MVYFCAPTPKEERWCPSRHQISANKFSDRYDLHQPLSYLPNSSRSLQVRKPTILDSEDPLSQEDYGNDHLGADDSYLEESGTISRLHNPPCGTTMTITSMSTAYGLKTETILPEIPP